MAAAVSGDAALENYREAWSALAMLREAVETLAPPGSVPNGEYCEPTPMAEAEAILAGIMAIATKGGEKVG